MTLVSLVGGGAIFMMVMSVQNSMVSSFDDFLNTWHFDVFLVFDNPQRIENIEPLVESYPGVTYAEILQLHETGARTLEDKDGLHEESIQLMAISKAGNAYRPDLRDGRFLEPEDEFAVVINEHVAQELGVGVGDEIIIELDDEDTAWMIVGMLFDIGDDQTNSIVWLDVLSKELNTVNRGSIMFVGAQTSNDDALETLATDLRAWLDDNGRNVSRSVTAAEVKNENISSLMIIVYLLVVIAVLIAVVGSVGLSGALSISAMERQKEIGVMRAIGASGKVTGSIFVGEGIIIGLVSWLLAVPLSVPLGALFTGVIGSTIDFQFSYSYSFVGVLIWLTVVVVLSMVASGMPAWRAARVSVREVLSYE